MNALKKVMKWISIPLYLWLILITLAPVEGSRVLSSSKGAVVMARGPVPPSDSSPCTHIGVGKGGGNRPCPPSTHRWWWMKLRIIALWDYPFSAVNKKGDDNTTTWRRRRRCHALDLRLLSIYIYNETMDYFLLWIRMTTTTTTMLLPCTWSATCNIYNETMVCFMRLLLLFFCFELIYYFYHSHVCKSFMIMKLWSFYEIVYFLIFQDLEVLWAGFKFFWLSDGLINYASDFNAPQKREA